MGFFKEKQVSPTFEQQNYDGMNGYGDDYRGGSGYDETAGCPPHTTERKLMLRIDAHVMPFLCIMYRTQSLTISTWHYHN